MNDPFSIDWLNINHNIMFLSLPVALASTIIIPFERSLLILMILNVLLDIMFWKVSRLECFLGVYQPQTISSNRNDSILFYRHEQRVESFRWPFKCWFSLYIRFSNIILITVIHNLHVGQTGIVKFMNISWIFHRRSQQISGIAHKMYGNFWFILRLPS